MKDKTLVMIPGPTPVARPIQEEMGREIQAFGDPRFVADYKSVIDDLGQLFWLQWKNICDCRYGYTCDGNGSFECYKTR